MKCYCDSQKKFNECCEPFLNCSSKPSTSKELMRSRYSAYILGNGAYLVTTTVDENRYEDDIKLIQEFSSSVVWLKLDIINEAKNMVEFKAYYRDRDGVKVQHERSNFIFKNGMWLYIDGELFNSKIERNEPCPCKSNKKYKKCCFKI
ncbi:YchJ family metal-binding protein [Sulfurimonas sp.]|uniref:YchJ family protein n=1 Tax=Sulfurimonas sp. TaxID=2022749 RepID=UPI0025DF4535|nr:YchJ family metal-binding protein [Sulfurimonas sp.]MDD5157067.1 YchJ family metal-binding protein [Sulfurimonas sp.]